MINLPLFKKNTQDNSKFLTIYLNSKEVRCLAIYSALDESIENPQTVNTSKYKIIGSGVQPLEEGSFRNGLIIDEEDVVQAIKIAVAKAHENVNEDILNTIWAIDGDMCNGLLTTVRSHRKNPSDPISDKEIKNLYEKLLEASSMQVHSDYLQTTANPEIDLEVFTSSNVYLKIDNQKTNTLENKQGKVIEIATFNAFTPSFNISVIQDVAKKTDLKLVALGPTIYCNSQWILKNNPSNYDFILVDISYDHTQIAVVFGGGIVDIRTLGIGYKHFIEGIGSKMGLTYKESGKVLDSYINKQLTESESIIVQTCIQETLDTWILGIELLFGEFSGVKTFASKFFITGMGSNIPDLINNLETQPWSKSIPFKESPTFERFDFTHLTDIGDSTEKVNSMEWLNNATLSIIHRELNL